MRSHATLPAVVDAVAAAPIFRRAGLQVVDLSHNPLGALPADVAFSGVAQELVLENTTLQSLGGLEPSDALTALEPGVWNAGVPITVVPVASVDALGRVAVDTSKLAELVAAGLPPEIYLLAPDSSRSERWRARANKLLVEMAHLAGSDGARKAVADAIAGMVPDHKPVLTTSELLIWKMREMLPLANFVIASPAASRARRRTREGPARWLAWARGSRSSAWVRSPSTRPETRRGSPPGPCR